MKGSRQRGTIDNRPVFVIVPILVAIGWYNWPGGRPEIFTPTVIGWLVAGAVLVAVIVGVALFLWARVRAYRRDVARAVGSEVTSEYHSSWGQSSVEYFVPMQRRGYPVKLTLHHTSTFATLEVSGGQAVPFRISGGPDGSVSIEDGAGEAAAQAFLDERVRSNLGRMAQTGKPANPAIIVTVGSAHVTIYKDGTMNVRETLLFLNLCWPVFDRALAACFDAPIDPPAKVCANCGGECCASCDGDHQPGCGCASMAAA